MKAQIHIGIPVKWTITSIAISGNSDSGERETMAQKSIHSKQQAQEIEIQTGKSQNTFCGEFISFLSHNKKWWLTPIFLVLLFFSLLLVLAGSGAAPFIYTLF